MNKFLPFLCLFLFVVARTQSLQDVLTQIQSEKAQIKTLLDQFNFNLNTFKTTVTQAVLADIKANGLYLGNRWRIAEEGTGSYEALVFRDMTTTKAGVDRRYAMWNQRYTDL